MNKIAVVGDIHGCYDELLELMEKIQLSNHHLKHIVFVGDYIDRGPKSMQVFDYVRKISNAVLLKGNHEDMMATELVDDKYAYWAENGGHQTKTSYNSIEAMYADAVDMKMLPYYFKFGRVVVSHAGIDPTLKLEEQSENNLLWSRHAVGYDGDYVDNAFSVFGHTPMRDVIRKKNQMAIDTGCVFGYKLSAVVLDEDANWIDTFQVEKV